MDSLETIGRELRDLRGDFISHKRAMRRDRRDDRDEAGPSSPLVARAVLQVLHAIKRLDLAPGWQEKAAVSPAVTSVPAWAGSLATSETAAFVMGLASANRAFPLVAQMAHAYSLTARKALSMEADASAAFTEEAAAIAVSSGRVRADALAPYSVKSILTASEELFERGQPDVQTLFTQLLNDACGDVIEEVFFGSAAASAGQPAGILSGVTSQSPGQSFAEDVKVLMTAVQPAVPVFIANPATRASLAASGSLLGFDMALLGSKAVEADALILIDADRIATGFGGQAKISVGREATVAEVDTAPPTDLMTASPVRSLWQTDSVGVRIVLPVSWAKAPGAVGLVQPVGW